ncbi:MAG: hypothetical protein PHS02_01310 [Candidatus ainarchaeum sp.]|nr:hypothetical protein [Candidatus ainarchaeum sp.]
METKTWIDANKQLVGKTLPAPLAKKIRYGPEVENPHNLYHSLVKVLPALGERAGAKNWQDIERSWKLLMKAQRLVSRTHNLYWLTTKGRDLEWDYGANKQAQRIIGEVKGLLKLADGGEQERHIAMKDELTATVAKAERLLGRLESKRLRRIKAENEELGSVIAEIAGLLERHGQELEGMQLTGHWGKRHSETMPALDVLNDCKEWAEECLSDGRREIKTGEENAPKHI